jgi:hypothetical protein
MHKRNRFTVTYTSDSDLYYPSNNGGPRKSGSAWESAMTTLSAGDDIRALIRPYWGGNTEKTEIETCSVRPAPAPWDNVTSYLWYSNFQGEPGASPTGTPMKRIGDLFRPTTGSNFQIRALASDVFADRQYRYANHHEMNTLFVQNPFPSGYSDGWMYTNSWWADPAMARPRISGNFADQDGSVREYFLGGTGQLGWISIDGFRGFNWNGWVPDDLVEED